MSRLVYRPCRPPRFANSLPNTTFIARASPIIYELRKIIGLSRLNNHDGAISTRELCELLEAAVAENDRTLADVVAEKLTEIYPSGDLAYGLERALCAAIELFNQGLVVALLRLGANPERLPHESAQNAYQLALDLSNNPKLPFEDRQIASHLVTYHLAPGELIERPPLPKFEPPPDWTETLEQALMQRAESGVVQHWLEVAPGSAARGPQKPPELSH